MPKMTAPSRIVLVCLLSLIGFWPVAIISPRLIMFDFINAIGLSFGLAVLWRYGPAAWQAIRCALRKQLSRGHLLVLGIETTWVAMVSRTLILWHWRWVGEIATGLDGLDTAFAAWIIVTGGVFHLLASALPDAQPDDDPIPTIEGRVLIWSLLSGILLGAAIAGARWYMSWTG
jgi:hypothetical protein